MTFFSTSTHLGPSMANGTAMTQASKVLIAYGALMWLACAFTYVVSLSDERTLREVGVWAKPMKFMAATALFAWTTVWVSHLANPAVTQTTAYTWIVVLVITTSLFEVAYITYQGAHGVPSHYNTSDPIRAMLFGLMALAAVGLTASQAWLAWEIWKARDISGISVITLGVVVGLVMTFFLATISGFMLGAQQPPQGKGLPLVGWHLHSDIRPAHFLAVHTQQFIPLWALFAERFLGAFAAQGFAVGSCIYLLLWAALTWAGVAH